MGKNQSASNLTNIIKQDASGNITFVSGSTTLMSVSSSGAVTTTGNVAGTASYASNAELLDGLDSTVFATTGSNTFTRVQYISSSINAVNFTSTASLYTDGGIRVSKDVYLSSSLFIKGDLTIFGTQSVNYITSSQLNISDNIITVNTSTPAVRFGGIAVQDSGSLATGLTGSLLWDSQRDLWLYNNPSGSTYDSAMVMMGPQNSGALGNEVGITVNAIPKGVGNHHMTSSGMFESGSTILIGSTNSAGAEKFGVTKDDGVADGLHIIADFNRSGASSAELILGYYASGSAVTGPVVYAANSQPLLFGAGSAERMRLTTAGNVGIGVTNPSEKLDINGSAKVTTRYYVDDGTNVLELGSSYIQAYLKTGAAPTNLQFYTGLTERMRITPAGSVGINTTSPVSIDLTGSLTIVKRYQGDTPTSTTAQAYYTNQSALYIFGRNSGISIISNNNEEGHIQFGNASTTRYARITTGTGTSAVGGDMYFHVGSDTERMRITSTGAMYMSRIGSDLTFADSVGGMYVRNNGNNAGTEEELRIFGRNIGFFSHSGTRYVTIGSSGNVGINTSTPSARLDIKMGGDGDMLVGRFSGGTAKLVYAYQAGSDGFLELRTGADAIVTKLSGYTGTPSYFLSNVLVGQTTGDLGQNGWQLQAAGGGHTSFAINNNEAFIFNNRNSGTTYEIDFRTLGTERGKISVTDSGTSYVTTSDYRVKEDLQEINGLEKVSAIKVYNFKFKDMDVRTDGVLAHELQEVLPYAVTGEKDGTKYQGVDYAKLTPVLVKAIQELNTKLDAANAEIEALKNK